MFAIGDSVKTKVQLYHIEARHPQTGEEIDVRLPRGHRLYVTGINPSENTVEVSLPDGFVATLDADDVEP